MRFLMMVHYISETSFNAFPCKTLCQTLLWTNSCRFFMHVKAAPGLLIVDIKAWVRRTVCSALAITCVLLTDSVMMEVRRAYTPVDVLADSPLYVFSLFSSRVHENTILSHILLALDHKWWLSCADIRCYIISEIVQHWHNICNSNSPYLLYS